MATAGSSEGLLERGTPPSYAGNSNRNSLPSYQSLYEELKDARRTSSGRGQYLQSVCNILANTVGFTIFLALSLAIPILMIVVGILNLGNCPAQHFVPIWLIVAGAVGAFQQTAAIASRINNMCCRCGLSSGRNDPTWTTLETLYGVFNGLLGCFTFAWFITGSVWVYSMYSPNTNSAVGVLYCDHFTYYLAFSLLTISYGGLLLICLCSCIVAFAVGSGSD